MATRITAAMQALSRFGELAWFKLPEEYNNVYDYHQVPYMGWRYTSPPTGIAQYIENAVREVPTELEWDLDRSRKNWVLLPSRILREAQRLDSPAFADVVHSINIHDQEFCLKALSDFEQIILHLQQIPVPES
ncbi:hypothetical protein AB0950_39360 [Streptomyces sp. NPDC007189]|uniref:hypothetical protein n=1 Tax=Streptomyces sp. NPDC007189 TaxID=3154315 RepID=UPI00345516ED